MAITIVVEDGTGKTDSTSYVSIADFKTYWTQHGTDYTSESDDTIALWLNEATFYADSYYCWCGSITNEDQALQWPRTGMYDRNGYSIDDDVIPMYLQYAICELAGTRQGTSETIVTAGVKSKSVGPLSVEYTGGGGETKTYVQANNYLASFICDNARLNLPK